MDKLFVKRFLLRVKKEFAEFNAVTEESITRGVNALFSQALTESVEGHSAADLLDYVFVEHLLKYVLPDWCMQDGVSLPQESDFIDFLLFYLKRLHFTCVTEADIRAGCEQLYALTEEQKIAAQDYVSSRQPDAEDASAEGGGAVAADEPASDGVVRNEAEEIARLRKNLAILLLAVGSQTKASLPRQLLTLICSMQNDLQPEQPYLAGLQLHVGQLETLWARSEVAVIRQRAASLIDASAAELIAKSIQAMRAQISTLSKQYLSGEKQVDRQYVEKVIGLFLRRLDGAQWSEVDEDCIHEFFGLVSVQLNRVKDMCSLHSALTFLYDMIQRYVPLHPNLASVASHAAAC